jgi:hypothetical protein
MDPYVKFECREFEWKSSVCEKGAKKPTWEGQKFEIDVKYLGDDITFAAFDQDPGKDEKIGKGDSKLSAFVCYEDWDEWFTVEHNGKGAGKLHLRTHWEPLADKEVHSSTDEMGQIQEAIKSLAQKKRDLTEQYNEVKETMDRHAEEYYARIEAENAEEGDDEKWDKKVARAEKRCEEEHARITALREALDEKAQEFEEKVLYEDSIAIQRGEEFKEKMGARRERAAQKKEEDHAKAEENEAANVENNKKLEQEMNDKIKALQGDAFGKDEKIRDEINEIAEKLLKINEAIAERLQKLAEL